MKILKDKLDPYNSEKMRSDQSVKAIFAKSGHTARRPK